ncbi:MAG: NAD(+)/NADH kinase [Anaerolineaceae bacterium]|nr:NAD(+)/NADH kinase [Anaerolineaceae bacterium]
MTLEQMCPQKLLILANAAVPKAQDLAGKVKAYLLSLGIKCEQNLLNDETDAHSLSLNEFDLLVAIGGDGTMLRSGHLCAPLDIPLLGINAGRFGFLVEVGEDEWIQRLPQVLRGDYRIEERMMLHAEFIQKGNPQHEWDVINEVVVCRGQYVRPIEVRVTMDESYLTSYVADGLIASTATGSTAYALAAGGPILPPDLRNILLIPIAPHLSLDRAVILAEGASVCIEVRSRHETVVSVDGKDPIIMKNEDRVKVSANNKSLKMIRFQDKGYFYRNLALYMDNNPIMSLKSNE